MEQLLPQIWDKIGTPLTYLLWGYIIVAALVVVGAATMFGMVFYEYWKDRKH